MRKLRSHLRRIAVASFLVGIAGGGTACALLADIETFQGSTVDASTEAVDASMAPSADGGCSGFMCGETCAAYGDPAFGCTPGNACRPCAARDHMTATCAGELCVSTCEPSFVDCNGSESDGCEVDPRVDPKNCGGCGKACTDPELPACYQGTCVIACPAPTTYCGSGCVDLATSTEHCGACGVACPASAVGGATPQCAGGKCSLKCLFGAFGDCNNDPVDGCETLVRTSDVNHCGSCAPCPTTPNAVASCATGSCRQTCVAPFGDCDKKGANGCECNLTTNNCDNGACVGPCVGVGVACTKDADCCGATANTHYCLTDGDGYPTTCGAR